MVKILIDSDDIESLAQAIAENVTTIGQLCLWLDDPDIIENRLIPYSGKWFATDGHCTVEIEADSGVDAAEQYVKGGDWGDGSETVWVDVRFWQQGIDASGKIVQVNEGSHTVTIKATEPPCIDDDEHDWQNPVEIVGGLKENPGVFSHGGGVIIQEVCMKCGCGKTTDTWAQNPDNGVQGLLSVSYEPNRYRDEIDRLAE